MVYVKPIPAAIRSAAPAVGVSGQLIRLLDTWTASAETHPFIVIQTTHVVISGEDLVSSRRCLGNVFRFTERSVGRLLASNWWTGAADFKQWSQWKQPCRCIGWTKAKIRKGWPLPAYAYNERRRAKIALTVETHRSQIAGYKWGCWKQHGRWKIVGNGSLCCDWVRSNFVSLFSATHSNCKQGVLVERKWLYQNLYEGWEMCCMTMMPSIVFYVFINIMMIV